MARSGFLDQDLRLTAFRLIGVAKIDKIETVILTSGKTLRKELSKGEGERKKFQAVFSRLGKKAGFRGYSEETLLLKNVVEADTRRVVSDHIWFSYTQGFRDARLTEGSRIEFEARIKKYSKGYVNSRYQINRKTSDYKLSHPTKIKVIS